MSKANAREYTEYAEWMNGQSAWCKVFDDDRGRITGLGTGIYDGMAEVYWENGSFKGQTMFSEVEQLLIEPKDKPVIEKSEPKVIQQPMTAMGASLPVKSIIELDGRRYEMTLRRID